MRTLRDNVFVQVFRDAAHGHILAEFAVASLVGAGLIVSWSFSFVVSAALLRGPSEGDRAHYPGLVGSTPTLAPISTVWIAPAASLPAVHPSRPRSTAPPHLHAIVTAAAVEREIPPHILAGLAEDESGWRPTVKGKNGEVGLLQLKQPVATWCGIKDRRDPRQNARCGARYLAAQFDRFGSWELAVVAFKAGPESIPENIPASSWAYAQRALQRAEAYR